MNERLEILQMIRENKISPEEGVRLLEAMEKSDSPSAAEPGSTKKHREEVKWLNIEIRTRSDSTFKTITPLRIPFSLVRVFFKFMSGANLPKRDFDPEEILRSLESRTPFELFAEDGGRAIRITAE